MDEETALVLTIQLIALSCIAGSLLLYLLCKVKTKRHTYDTDFTSLNVGTGRSVLITSCDTVFGLQLALHLSALGFRVFAGFKQNDRGNNSCEDRAEGSTYFAGEAGKILRAKLKQREVMMSSVSTGAEENGIVQPITYGTMVTLPLDVTREDSLHEAVNIVRRHLPAGEDGLWAVVNTAGICYKGRLDLQESCQWDAMIKVNLIGTLRTARAFLPLLKNKQGRLINIGTGCESCAGGTVAYSATRHAVLGANSSLRNELGPLGIHVITLQPDCVPSEKLFARPRTMCNDTAEGETLPNDRYVKYNLSVVPNYAMHIIEEALLTHVPKSEYSLSTPSGFSNYMTAITERFANIQHKKNIDGVGVA